VLLQPHRLQEPYGVDLHRYTFMESNIVFRGTRTQLRKIRYVPSQISLNFPTKVP
jgi:hypothetical protein